MYGSSAMAGQGTLDAGEKDQSKLFAFFAALTGVHADTDKKEAEHRKWHEQLMASLRRANQYMVPIEGPDDLAPAYTTNEHE